MQRVTITLDDDLMKTLDGYMRDGGHANRSEAIRDLVRMGLEKKASAEAAGKACVGALVYVYDHETRRLAERLTSEQHAHHDLSVATMHVHLDAHRCLEIAVLKGETAEVRHFAAHVTGERGVQYGQLLTIPVKPEASHTHGHGRSHAHVSKGAGARKASLRNRSK